MAPLDLAALAAIVLIGLPHGALDGAIAIHLGFTRKILHFIWFLALYIAMAGVVVAAWLLAPTACLLGFLIISMLHFGAGDARHGTGWLRSAEILAHGGLVIVGISQMHHVEVDVIFGYLTGRDTALLWQGIDVLTLIVGMAVVVCLAQALWHRRWRGTAFELGALAVLFALTPPLVGFAVYFCCVHSARHVYGIVNSLRREISRFSLLNQAAAFSVASWVAGGAAILWFADMSNPEPFVLRVVFIGLAALTVPHMILVDGFFRRSGRTLKRQFISR
uniref:Probable beta-carotene 15,15'-dioxygenase n=1 Tax=uncultured marine bacterium HF10_25F10 TaxID=413068 RepID=A4GIK2_9BACT|nr:15,15'-beta-carotene dioxygenase Blh [uncultured marine bacterium HF10_25F10]